MFLSVNNVQILLGNPDLVNVVSFGGWLGLGRWRSSTERTSRLFVWFSAGLRKTHGINVHQTWRPRVWGGTGRSN